MLTCRATGRMRRSGWPGEHVGGPTTASVPSPRRTRPSLVETRSGRLERLMGQELPGAAVLDPERHYAELERDFLPFRVQFDSDRVASNGVVADHADCGIADRDRFVDRLLGDNSAHELRLGLAPAAGMAEDELVGQARFKCCLVAGHHCLDEIVDCFS